MAVLPTPGSPINTGLFLLLRDKILITLRISSSRPMTGSTLLSLTFLVISRPYLFKTSFNSSSFPGYILYPSFTIRIVTPKLALVNTKC